MKRKLLFLVISLLLILTGCTNDPFHMTGLANNLTFSQGINWRGEFASPPVSANVADAYFNTANGSSYVWNGVSWDLLAQKGATGAAGNASSIAWGNISGNLYTQTDLQNQLIAINSTISTVNTTANHTNRSILDAITAAFTTALKSTYDAAVSLINTHVARNDNPHNTTADQVAVYVPGSNISSAGYRFTWNGTNVVLLPPSFSGSTNYYFQNTTANVSFYNQMLSGIPYPTKSTNITLSVTNNQTIAGFITNANSLSGITSLPAGAFDIHVHALKSGGTQDVILHSQLWETDAVGNNISIIGEGEATPPLTSNETEYNMVFVTANPYIFASNTSRLLVVIHTSPSGGGSVPDVTLFWGGTADSHLALPAQTVDTSLFVLSTNITTTPTANKTPQAGVNGTIDGWVSRTVAIILAPSTTNLTVGNGTYSWIIPADLDGWSIVNAQATVQTASSSGKPTFNVYSVTNSTYLLTTNITIDVGQKISDNATIPSVINPTFKVVHTGYEIRWADILLAGTGTQGEEIRITFRKP